MDALHRALRLFHTARHLRPGQIGWRLWYRVHRPRPDLRPAPPARRQDGAWTPPVAREPSLLGPAEVCFLNQRARIDAPDCWNDPRFDKLWLYNLHYFDDLNARDAQERHDWHRALIARWIAENPPGSGNGWEPYPTSLRIVNWIQWILDGNQPSEAMHHSLAVQARWLRRNLEYHILGNHLLANAKALCFAGRYFAGPEGERWWRKGHAILERELPEQILPDGGHFERSPMYHLLALEDLLDLVNLHQAYGEAVPDGWHETIRSMLAWSQVMRHPDGEIPFFNDAAFGIAPAPNTIDAYAHRLGIEVSPTEAPKGIWYAPASGYVRLTKRQATVFTDIAPVGPDYLPGHAHADTLSFEVSLDEERIFVNGGTSIYGHGPERHRQRSTCAHNTIAVDGTNSSEVWSGFRVARRARPFDVSIDKRDDALSVSAAHDGYHRLTGRPSHRRTWHLSDRELSIQDEVDGQGHHTIEAFWLLAPGLTAGRAPSENAVSIHAECGRHIEVEFQTALEFSLMLEPATWHPRFGVEHATQRLRIVMENSLPVTLTTRIRW